MTAEAVADGIVERERSDAALRYGVLDPACFKEDGGPSIAERMNKVLIQARLRPFHAADNSRVPQRGSMGGLGSVALPPRRTGWPADDLLLQHLRREHS